MPSSVVPSVLFPRLTLTKRMTTSCVSTVIEWPLLWVSRKSEPLPVQRLV
jgi:hypothetical protein